MRGRFHIRPQRGYSLVRSIPTLIESVFKQFTPTFSLSFFDCLLGQLLSLADRVRQTFTAEPVTS